MALFSTDAPCASLTNVFSCNGVRHRLGDWIHWQEKLPTMYMQSQSLYLCHLNHFRWPLASVYPGFAVLLNTTVPPCQRIYKTHEYRSPSTILAINVGMRHLSNESTVFASWGGSRPLDDKCWGGGTGDVHGEGGLGVDERRSEKERIQDTE